MKSLILSISLLLFAVEALSCSCENPPSILQAYQGAELVVEGTVQSIDVVPLSESIREIPVGSGTALSALRPTEESVTKVNIQVSKVYKGNLEEDIVTIFTPTSGATCGYIFFEKDKEFIVYGYQRSFLFNTFVKAARGLEIPNTFWTNQCSRTHTYSEIEADQLKQIQEAKKTFFLPRFSEVDQAEILNYFYQNNIVASGQQSSDLQAIQLLNQHLEIIDSEFYIDVEVIVGTSSIEVLRFYAKNHVTENLLSPLSTMQIKYIKLPDEEGIFISLSLQEENGKKLIFRCSKHSEKIILSYTKDNLLYGKYLEFDTFGALRIQGTYSHEDKDFTQTSIEYDALTFEEIKIVEKFKKAPKRSGKWMFFDIYGDLEEIKEY